MRNIDDADSTIAQAPDDLVQFHRILSTEHCGRFVEDDDLDVLRKSLGDLDHLLVGDGQGADKAPGIDIETQTVDQLFCASSQAESGNKGR